MKVMLDLNVVLDVIQKRKPHYGASAQVLDLAASSRVDAFVPSHLLTTVHYIVHRHADLAVADGAIDWILANLAVASAGHDEFCHARALGVADFEDAVVASLAETVRCEFIVTRNVPDFAASPVQPVTPIEFLAVFHSTQ
jgi:predicted nucleic acid-binding protein